MSGLDELILDIPICPKCGKKPWFWILNIDADNEKWLWLFGDIYLMSAKDKYEDRVTNFSRRHPFADINEVIKVTCRPMQDYYDVAHEFEPGSHVFNEVIRYTRAYMNRGEKSQIFGG